MGYSLRIQFPGAVYHIYSRGNEKKDIFRDDKDRKKFISIIATVKKKLPFELHAYVLMPNHYHMLVTTPDGNISKIMQHINSHYGSYFNWKHKRVGYLFQSKYKSILVGDNAYFKDLTRYIHVNPAAMSGLNKLEEYKWSSLPRYMNPDKKDIIDLTRIREIFGSEGSAFVKKYTEFLSAAGAVELDNIRMDMFDKIAVGSDEFLKKISSEFIKRKSKVPAKLKKLICVPYETVLDCVCRVFRVNNAEIFRKKGRFNFARKAAIYLLHSYSGMSPSEMTAIFSDTDRSNISKSLKSAKEEVNKATAFYRLVSKVEFELSHALGSDPKVCDN